MKAWQWIYREAIPVATVVLFFVAVTFCAMVLAGGGR